MITRVRSSIVVSCRNRYTISLFKQHQLIHTFQTSKPLTLLHSERPKLYTILAFLSTIGLILHLIQEHNEKTGDGWSQENLLNTHHGLVSILQEFKISAPSIYKT